VTKRLLVGALLIGCASTPTPRTHAHRAEEDAAVGLLRAGRFDDATTAATQLLAVDAANPPAHAIAAITRFIRASHQLRMDFETMLAQAFRRGEVDHQYLRFAGERLDGEWAQVARDLEAAAADRDFALELCPACWQVDWNGNGRLDSRDARVLQIEVDADGNPLPDEDPRRTPTFRFDRGDLYWALALVDFLRASLDVVLTYRFPDLATLNRSDRLVLPLADRARIARAREEVLAGLAAAERARAEYLAETDDDREWVPNPRQKSHPLPLPVDDALYATWAALLGDARRLLESKEGLDVAQIAQLGDRQWRNPPRGFIDLGKLFAEPHELVIRLSSLDHVERDAEPLLHDLFGSAYVASMKPTPLVGRLDRMKGEIERGSESFERKLRYLFWLN
jgi:hypothetical protein